MPSFIKINKSELQKVVYSAKRNRDVDWVKNSDASTFTLEHSHQVCQMPNIWHLTRQTPKTEHHEVC